MPQITPPPVGVYLDGKLTDGVRVLSCSYGKGSQGLATAELLFANVGQNRGHIDIENTELAQFEQPAVEIVIAGDNGERVIWCGDILARHYVLGESSEVTCTARVEDYHFGLPLKKSWYWNPKTSQPISLHLPTVFNPELDGLIWPNCSQKKHPKLAFNLFLHPESQQTDKAKEYAESTKPTLWTLAEAVFYLCQSLNSGQLSGGQDVQNPTLAELFDVLGKDDGSLLRNYEAPFGKYLPEQLDLLLEPFGYGWTVDSLGLGKRKIRVFARGVGPSAGLKLQAGGASVDPKLTNVSAISAAADLSGPNFNFLTVVGDYKRFERTFYLKPAWKQEYDARPVADLTNNATAWKDTPELSRVWRDWVLNEAGDYNGLRDDSEDFKDLDKPYNFDDLFGQNEWIARRRKFEPCLTLNNDGAPKGQLRGIWIEWSNDGGRDYKPIDQLNAIGRSIVLLAKECGIRFDGFEPPAELMLYGTRFARVRVTCSIASDTRIETFVDRKPSFLQRTKRQFLSVGSKFKFRERNWNSVLYDSETATKIDKDDSPKMETLAAGLLDRWNTASISGSVALIGVDHSKQLAIGSLADSVSGRRVACSLTPKGGKFPQIVGLQFDFQSQATAAVLDTYRGERTI